MSSCYSYQTMHFKNSSLDVDAVYVLTMENSDRLEKIKMELYRCKPGKIVIIQINKGFKDCRKRLCSDSKNDIDITHKDISHAYLNAFKHALENQYQNILVLEDDATFSNEFYNAENLKVVNEFIPKLDSNKFVFALGLIPWMSLYHSYGIRRSVLSTGTHATIFPASVIENIVRDCSSISDMDMYVNMKCTRYFHHYPLVTQTFPETENFKNWGADFGILGTIARFLAGIIIWLFGLHKAAEPGTTIIYTMNKVIYDLGIPLLIIFILFLNIKKEYV